MPFPAMPSLIVDYVFCVKHSGFWQNNFQYQLSDHKLMKFGRDENSSNNGRRSRKVQWLTSTALFITFCMIKNVVKWKKNSEFKVNQENCSLVDRQRWPSTRLQFSRSTAACAFKFSIFFVEFIPSRIFAWGKSSRPPRRAI